MITQSSSPSDGGDFIHCLVGQEARRVDRRDSRHLSGGTVNAFRRSQFGVQRPTGAAEPGDARLELRMAC